MRSIGHETAIITGASSGIGAALARRLAKAGVRVGLTARRGDRLGALVEEIRGRGGSAVFATADARDGPAFGEAIGQLRTELGTVDLLIANAGVGRSTPAIGFSAATIAELFEVNLLGAARAVEAVLPAMTARGRGQIVGISSLAGIRGLPGSAGYCASKAALTTLLDGLRADLRRHGVDVTTVHPGYVETPMTAGASHAKPWEMSADRAAAIIVDGIARRRSRIDFPWQMAALMRLVRLLPTGVFDRLAIRLIPSDRRP